jgi:hypothetical protein
MSLSSFSKSQMPEGGIMAELDDAQHLLVLHQRLLDGDRVVPEELAELLLDRLAREVARGFPHTDIHLVYDGVTDALLDYCSRPAGFDTSLRVPLGRFLARAARLNVANLVRGEKRRKAREEKWGELSDDKIVELCPSAGKLIQNELQVQQQQLAELAQRLKDPADKKIFALQMKGERRTSEFAKVMGVTHLPATEQQREVKRAKDRITKLLQRRKEPRP